MTNSFIQAALGTLVLGSNVPAFAQPINMDQYSGEGYQWLPADEFVEDRGGGKYCFNEVLASISDGPSTPQLLAMFFEGVVEGANGKVYAVNNDSHGVRGIPSAMEDKPKGLYEVIEINEFRENPWSGRPQYSCVEYRLLLEDEDVGQIIYAGNWPNVSPIILIGVKQDGGVIYGFYEESGVWKKKTGEGNAMDGSLVEATNQNGPNGIIGVSTDGRMVGIWGDFNKFVAGRSQTVYCNSKPAGIYEWATPFRGRYCPANGDGQIAKYTWHGDKSKERDSNLMWETARSITRLSPESGIFGISTQGKLLTLVNDGDTILSVPIRPTLLGDQDIDAVGGVGENDEEGIYVLSEGMVYNVYKESDACKLSYNWKAVAVMPTWPSTVFANHDGIAYMLTGYGPDFSKITGSGSFCLHRLDNRLPNRSQRQIQCGNLCNESIHLNC